MATIVTVVPSFDVFRLPQVAIDYLLNLCMADSLELYVRLGLDLSLKHLTSKTSDASVFGTDFSTIGTPFSAVDMVFDPSLEMGS